MLILPPGLHSSRPAFPNRQRGRTGERKRQHSTKASPAPSVGGARLELGSHAQQSRYLQVSQKTCTRTHMSSNSSSSEFYQYFINAFINGLIYVCPLPPHPHQKKCFVARGDSVCGPHLCPVPDHSPAAGGLTLVQSLTYS